MGVNVSDADLLGAMNAGASNVTDEQLLGQMGTAPTTKAAPAKAVSKPSYFADIVRTLPGGLVKGASMIAGLPGDINALMDAGANKLTGANISTRQLPTSNEIGNTVAAPFGGFYEPKTIPGKFADTAAQFSPAALAPGNALLRAARVALPAGGSEAAGEMAEGTPYEGAARLAGAVVGGAATGAIRSIPPGGPKIPSTQQIRQAATAAYQKAEQAGVIVKQSEVQNLAGQIQHEVENAGIDPTLHPKAVAAVNRIANSTGDLTLKKIDILRRVANGAAGSIDKDESRIAHIVLDKLDDFVENLSPGQLVAGNGPDASKAITEARSLWAKQAKSNAIDELFERAKNRAETVNGSGYENALRVEFRGLAQNAKRMARFSPDEQAAIKTVARGGPIGNFARTIGKLAPTNAIMIMSELGGAAVDPKALAVPAAGLVGRGLATALTKRNALSASELVRSGGLKPVTKQAFTPELLPALLARQREQQQNQLAYQ